MLTSRISLGNYYYYQLTNKNVTGECSVTIILPSTIHC
jgi:hypothetical protein